MDERVQAELEHLGMVLDVLSGVEVGAGAPKRLDGVPQEVQAGLLARAYDVLVGPQVPRGVEERRAAQQLQLLGLVRRGEVLLEAGEQPFVGVPSGHVEAQPRGQRLGEEHRGALGAVAGVAELGELGAPLLDLDAHPGELGADPVQLLGEVRDRLVPLVRRHARDHIARAGQPFMAADG